MIKPFRLLRMLARSERRQFWLNEARETCEQKWAPTATRISPIKRVSSLSRCPLSRYGCDPEENLSIRYNSCMADSSSRNGSGEPIPGILNNESLAAGSHRLRAE